MQYNNAFAKLFIVTAAAMLVMVWGMPSFAQMGGTNYQDPNSTMRNQTQRSSPQGNYSDKKMSGMGGEGYIIYIPASGSANTCHDVLKDFSSTTNSMSGGSMKDAKSKSSSGKMGDTGHSNMSMMNQRSNGWEWGCSSDDRALYVFTNAPNEKEALEQVPSNLRSQAQIIRLNRFSEQSEKSEPASNESNMAPAKSDEKY